MEAFRYYQDANAAAQGQDPRLEGYLLSHLVHIDKEQGNLDAAQEQLVELIKFMSRLGNMDMLPIFYADLGEL